MKKILIIDSNNHVTNLIKEKIEDKLDFEVLIRNNKEEARKIIENNHKFFLCISSYNNIGEKKGESIEYTLNEGIPTIVLIDKIKKKIIKYINQFNIVDYVSKEKLEDILFLIYLVERLFKNKFYKSLIIGDSKINRSKTIKLLNNQLIETIETDNPYEGIKILKEEENIKILFIDFKLEGINGLELVEQIRKFKPKEKLIIVANPQIEKTQLSAQFLKMGANDFISNNVIKEEFNSRINNLLEGIENVEKMKDFAYKDFLTNLYNRRYFFREMKDFLIQNPDSTFSVTMVDIDNFKSINDKFGHEAGDKVIKALADIFINNTKNSDLVSRFGGEEFCIVLKNITLEDNLNYLEKIRIEVEETVISYNDKKINFTISIGTVLKEANDKSDITALINKADTNLYEAKETGKNKIVCK